MIKEKQYNPKGIYFSNRIMEILGGIFDHPLTIIEAPMGYGKTTAVKGYLNETQANVLWQRIYDDSSYAFWKGFSRLFSGLDDNCSQNLLSLGFPDDSVLLQEALMLIGAIEIPAKTVLVIDDYHLIENPEVNRFIEYLTINEIINLHIVIIARYTEFQNQEELKLKGFLYQITQESFEFTPKEIAGYYKACGISLKGLEADKLYSLTEGWISALYLIMLGFISEGGFVHTINIYNLIEKAIYLPFSPEIKKFLLTLSVFDSFTLEQAAHMWGKDDTRCLLTEITGKNAFVTYDAATKTYQVHNIFSNFLKDILEQQEPDYRREMYRKAGDWFMKTGDYLVSMNYYYLSEDFEALLTVLELAGPKNINNEHKALLIKYLEDCPGHIRAKHHLALLIYAMRLFSFNEIALFQKTCGEFVANIHNDGDLDEKSRNQLLGEFELILSFTKYNDIQAMSAHHKKAGLMMIKPTAVINENGSWTLGSSSVLYMFYRESGMLKQHVQDMIECMPHYYKLTRGHGNGAEHVMQAEWHYNQGDLENAEIVVNKALYAAREKNQTAILISAMFLQMRLALLQGNLSIALDFLQNLRHSVLQCQDYLYIHILDLCESYIYLLVNQSDRVPTWVAHGEFKSSRLFFPSMAMNNFIYGRLLLVKKEYLKLIGVTDQFNALASIFPNLLAKVYNLIHLAGANERIFRRGEALKALEEALDIAMPDKVYMPFAENGDYIKTLLEQIYQTGLYREDIIKILALYADFKKTTDQIVTENFSGEKPQLTERELEIARLAADGLTNREIGERLFVSENTIKTQLKSIFEKLRINSRALLRQSLKEQM